MRGIDRERGEDGKDPFLEHALELFALGLLQVLPVRDPYPARVEQRLHVVFEELHLRGDQLLRAFPDRVDLLPRAHAVRRRARHTGAQLLVQPRDANLEELVQIAAEDREKPSTLERRPTGLPSAREHPRVVIERRELAIQEPRLRHDRRRDARSGHA